MQTIFPGTKSRRTIPAFRFGIAVLISSFGFLRANSLEGLVTNPPFGAPPRAPTTPTATNILELRSVMQTGQTYAFSIFESASKKSRWIRAGEAMGAIVVRRYDPEKSILTVEYNGKEMNLAYNVDSINLTLLASDSGGSFFSKRANPTVVYKKANVVPPLSKSEAGRLNKIAELLRGRMPPSETPPPAEHLGSEGEKS